VRNNLDTLREQLLDAALIIDQQDLVRGYGHVSARVPGRDAMLITPRRGPGLLSDPDEMLVLDFEGDLLEGDGPVAIEAIMHGVIYRTHPNVHALVRTHSKFVNVMGILGTPPRPVHGFGSFLGPEVPIFSKPFLISSSELAQEVSATLGDAEALVLRGNGDIVPGRSVPEATVKAIFLEQSCELQYLAMCAGQPVYMTPDEIKIRREPGYDHFDRAWEYYREQLYADEIDDED
jgi:ribulose-5-phosphate 4-epimerase/fuculose-1-phosphate aldolase